MKSFSVLVAIAFSVLFLACEEDAIPIPLPPQSQTTVNEPPPPVEQKVEMPIPVEKPSESAKPAKAPAKEPPPARTAVYFGNDDSEQLSKGRYIIQVGIFPAEASAKKLIKKLAEDGIKAYNAKVENPDPNKGMIGTYNRVRIGFFAAKPNAETFAKARLEPLGYSWWVDRSRNDNVGKVANYEPEESFAVERIPEQKPPPPPKQMSEQERREAERAAAVAAAKEEYKAIAKAANASVTSPQAAPAKKAAPPPPAKAKAATAPAPAKTKKTTATKEAEIDSRGRVKMKSRR